jgi:hypothetical protein
MRTDVSKFLLGANRAPRVELALTRPDGELWLLTVSPGVERFIGFYPRLTGFACGGPLLEYRRVEPAG